MSAHYKYPMLLIEFDQDKSFSLRSVNEAKSGARGGGGSSSSSDSRNPSEIDVQSKLVLLTTAFSRLRVIWSSSPYATADIFEDLKQSFAEPDVSKVAAVGFDETNAEGGFIAGSNEHSINLTPQDLLRAMPGITTMNYHHIMNSVRNISELCDLTVEELSELIGTEAGRKLHRFINQDNRRSGIARLSS